MSEQQAGWYPDPSGDASKLRYWDGTQWTSNFTDTQPQSAFVQEAQPVQPTQPVQAPVQPTQPQAVQPQAPYNYNYNQPQSQAYVQAPSQSNGLAIAALICGIVGFCSFGLASIAAIILGVMGRKKPVQQGLATAGLIMGIASLVLWILYYVLVGLAIFSFI